ncbi:hypothetical protein HDU83_007967 [Entophlyctis luteolus]|nr:hypothetical protein HDU83_007967 [Entophlyctis luteolus]
MASVVGETSATYPIANTPPPTETSQPGTQGNDDVIQTVGADVGFAEPSFSFPGDVTKMAALAPTSSRQLYTESDNYEGSSSSITSETDGRTETDVNVVTLTETAVLNEIESAVPAPIPANEEIVATKDGTLMSTVLDATSRTSTTLKVTSNSVASQSKSTEQIATCILSTTSASSATKPMQTAAIDEASSPATDSWPTTLVATVMETASCTKSFTILASKTKLSTTLCVTASATAAVTATTVDSTSFSRKFTGSSALSTTKPPAAGMAATVSSYMSPSLTTISKETTSASGSAADPLFSSKSTKSPETSCEIEDALQTQNVPESVGLVSSKHANIIASSGFQIHFKYSFRFYFLCCWSVLYFMIGGDI